MRPVADLGDVTTCVLPRLGLGLLVVLLLEGERATRDGILLWIAFDLVRLIRCVEPVLVGLVGALQEGCEADLVVEAQVGSFHRSVGSPSTIGAPTCSRSVKDVVQAEVARDVEVVAAASGLGMLPPLFRVIMIIRVGVMLFMGRRSTILSCWTIIGQVAPTEVARSGPSSLEVVPALQEPHEREDRHRELWLRRLLGLHLGHRLEDLLDCLQPLKVLLLLLLDVLVVCLGVRHILMDSFEHCFGRARLVLGP